MKVLRYQTTLRLRSGSDYNIDVLLHKTPHKESRKDAKTQGIHEGIAATVRTAHKYKDIEEL